MFAGSSKIGLRVTESTSAMHVVLSRRVGGEAVQVILFCWMMCQVLGFQEETQTKLPEQRVILKSIQCGWLDEMLDGEVAHIGM